MKDNDKNRVAIFLYYAGSLKFHPSVVNSGKMWVRNGYEVDIFKCRNDDEGIDSSERLRIIHVCNYRRNPLLQLISLFTFIGKSFSRMRGKQYKALIGIDAYGLMIAWILAKLFKSTLVYHSLEILSLKANFMALQKKGNLMRTGYLLHHFITKMVERRLHQKVHFTIIQDEIRWKILKEINRLPNSAEAVIVPNSPMFDNEPVRESDYLRNKYSIAKGKKIVLYAGGLAEWTGVVRILEDIKRWPETVVFVIHGRGPKDYINVLEQMIHGHDRKIILSLDQLVEEQYNTLVKSAHIGIAWYKDIKDPNTYYIGAASGKLFYYLKFGLPVITNKWPGLIEIVEGNVAGRCADSEADIGPMIEDIFVNYDAYSNNARKCFEKYEYSLYYEHVVDAVL